MALLAWRRAPFCLAVLLIATASALVAVPGRAAAQSATCGTAISAGTVPAPGAVGDPWRPTQWSLDQLDFEAQWPRTTGAGVKVAVIDTAPTMSHEDLAGHYTDGCSVIANPDARIRWDNPGAYALSPTQGHAVWVASVLAATPGNGLGISGAAPGVSIIPVDVAGSEMVFNAALLGPAIRWAVDAGADIVNLSLVTPGDVAAVRSAVQYAESRGVLVVAAVGNNANVGSPINYPAGYSTVLGVGATTEARGRYSNSSVNSSVSVVAPGEWLPGASGETAGAYNLAIGTSAATPHVSALAALLLQLDPSLSPAALRGIIKNTAEDLGPAGYDTQFGNGLIDPGAAVALLDQLRQAKPVVPSVSAVPGDRQATVSWAHPSLHQAVVSYTVTLQPGNITRTVDRTVRSSVVTGLTNGTNYTASVRINTPLGPGGAVSTTVRPVAPPNGYWLVEADGDTHAFGGATQFPSLRPSLGGANAIALAARPNGDGFWVLASDGRILEQGKAPNLGDVNRAVMTKPGERVSTIAAAPDGNGVWVFSTAGRIFAFGSARPASQMQNGNQVVGLNLNGQIVHATATRSGKGVYMVAADGGVFTAGDAVFTGSVPQVLGSRPLNRPVVGIVSDVDGRGYWLVASDGGVFSFEAPFRGALPAIVPYHLLQAPVNGMVAQGTGYLLVAGDGGVFAFGVTFQGSLGGNRPNSPVTGIGAYG